MATQQTMGLREWSTLIGLSVLWGGSFFFVGVAIKELPPFTIVTLRVGLAALALFAVIHVIGLSMPRSLRTWTAFFCMGLLNNVIPFCLITWGQTQIAVGLASILNATTPLFAVIIAHLLTPDEKMSGNKLGGVVIGFLGVTVIVGPVAFSGLGSNIWAEIAVLGAAISYSFAGVFGRRFRTMGIPPLISATGQVMGSTVILVPIALLVDRPWTIPVPDLATWGAVGGIAVFSTALAYIFYFRLLAAAGATNLMLVTFLIPVTAILLGYLVLDQRLQSDDFIGMALIGIGLAAIDGRLVTTIKRRLPVHQTRHI